MFRGKDVILLTVITLASLAGLVWPDQGKSLSPLLTYLLMAMLLLSFLNLEPSQVWAALKARPGALVVLGGLKLVILPALVYPLARWLIPDYALAFLLLAGTPTGVTAPFFTLIIGGNPALTLVMAAATSLLLPLTLPLMVKLLAGRVIQFDLLGLALLLSAIIFIPLGLVWTGRKVVPRAVDGLAKWAFPLSLAVMSAINFGAFGRYAGYLKGNPEQVLVSFVLSIILFVFQAAIGWVLLRRSSGPDRLAAMGSLVWINNVLIIVLGAELGDPLTSVMSAIYMIPLFCSIVPFTRLGKLMVNRSLGPDRS